MSVLLGRGCPYNCTYCCNHALKKAASGKYVRMRSPNNIVNEIKLLHEIYPYQREFFFEVETISADKDWLFDLCDCLEEFNTTINHKLVYGCNFRISTYSVDPDVFAALKRANLYKINIGLEAGSERVRREILKRNYSNQQYLEAVKLARQHGFKIWVFNMIGLPDETVTEHLETVQLNRVTQPDSHYTGIFFPYPGTALYQLCLQKGYIDGPLYTSTERRQAVLDLPNFPRRQIQKAYIWFTYRVYRGHQPLWWIIIRTILRAVKSNPTMNLLFRKTVQWPIFSQVRAKLAKS